MPPQRSWSVGDPVEVWSRSLKSWGRGSVKAINGEMVTLEFLLPSGNGQEGTRKATKELYADDPNLRPGAAMGMQPKQPMQPQVLRAPLAAPSVGPSAAPSVAPSAAPSVAASVAASGARQGSAANMSTMANSAQTPLCQTRHASTPTQVRNLTGKYLVLPQGVFCDMNQQGNRGYCTAGWNFSVFGDTVSVKEHSGLSGKIKGDPGSFNIVFNNGVTFAQNAEQASSKMLSTCTALPTTDLASSNVSSTFSAIPTTDLDPKPEVQSPEKGEVLRAGTVVRLNVPSYPALHMKQATVLSLDAAARGCYKVQLDSDGSTKSVKRENLQVVGNQSAKESDNSEAIRTAENAIKNLQFQKEAAVKAEDYPLCTRLKNEIEEHQKKLKALQQAADDVPAPEKGEDPSVNSLPHLGDEHFSSPMSPSGGGKTWECPECGETNKTSRSQCNSCGSSKPGDLADATTGGKYKISEPSTLEASGDVDLQTTEPMSNIDEEDADRVDLSKILEQMEEEKQLHKKAAEARHADPKEDAERNKCGLNVERPQQGASVPADVQPPGIYDQSDSEDDSAAQPADTYDLQLDLIKLGELFAKNDEVLQLLRGKSIVVLLGKTGTGKTTLMQAIAGKRLIKKKYQRKAATSKDSSAEREVYVAEHALDGFDIGHDQESQTKQIKQYMRGEVVYLDSAGYEDTVGIEVDISTAVAFEQAARVCDKLRFVVLIGAVSILEDKGGGIRSMAKLMSNLVTSFKDHKLAFTFLFTHTDHLAETAHMDLPRIRERLRDRIADTVVGTRDSTTKDILKWMQKCLTHGFPFVDVFHPEKSDFKELISVMEKFSPEDDGKSLPAIGLAENQTPRDVVKCGLTNNVHLVIRKKLDELLQDLRAAFEQNDVNEVRKVLRTFQWIHRYIETDHVKDAYKTADAEKTKQSQKISEAIYRMVGFGTDDRSDFSEPIASSCLKYIAVLRAISMDQIGDSSVSNAGDGALTNLRLQVQALTKRLCSAFEGVDRLPSFPDAYLRLSKLRAWAGAHQEFQKYASRGIRAVEGYIRKVVLEFGKVTLEHVEEYVDFFQRVELASIDIGRFKALGVSDHNVEDVFLKAQRALESRIADDAKKACAALRKILSPVEEQKPHEVKHDTKDLVRTFTERSFHLKQLSKKLADKGVLQKLVQHAKQTCKGLFDEVNATTEEESNSLVKQLAGDDCDGQSIQPRMRALKAVAEAKIGLPSGEDHRKMMYKRSNDEVVSKVKEWKRQLDFLCSQVSDTFLSTPTKHVELLKKLSAFTWIDAYLEDKHKFVHASIEELKKKYDTRILHVKEQFQVELKRYLQQADSSRSDLEMMRNRFAEVNNMKIVGSAYPGLETKCTSFVSLVTTKIQEWLSSRKSSLRDAPKSLKEIDALCAAVMDEVIRAATDLAFLKPASSQLESCSSDVHKFLASYKCSVEEVMKGNQQYHLKRVVLDAMTSWQSQGFTHVLALLPNLSEMETTLGNQIRQDAGEIRKMMESDLESAESELNQLKIACEADGHIHSKFAHDIDQLNWMIESRQAGVDDIFLKRIEDRDFKDMFKELEPLASSEDTLKKARFQQRMTALAACANNIISEGGAGESATRTEAALTALAAIDGRLGILLKQHKSIDVTEAASKLKSRVQENLSQLLTEFDSALSSFNVLGVIKVDNDIADYTNRFKSILSEDLQNRAAGAKQQTKAAFAAVKEMANDFVDNTKKPEKERKDTTRFHNTLNNLAVSVSDPAFENARQFYRRQIKELSEKLVECHQHQHEYVEKHSYSGPIEVYTYLKKEWDKGLRSHNLQLNFEIAKELEVLQQKQLEKQKVLQTNCTTPGIIENEWKPLMDSLYRERGSDWRHYQQYQEYQGILKSNMIEFGRNASEALQNRNYEMVASCVQSLLQIQTSLRGHLLDARGLDQWIHDFMNKIVQELKTLLHALGKVLEENRADAFERLLMQCYEFLFHLVKVCKSLVGTLEGFHWKLHEQIQGKINLLLQRVAAFDFKAVVESITTLRSFAFALTGIYPLYLEIVGDLSKDKRLEAINEMCDLHFNAKALNPIGIHYAILDVGPNAEAGDIHKAYKKKSLEHHPDSFARRGIHGVPSHAMQQRIQQAKEELENLSIRQKYQNGIRSLFLKEIADIPKQVEGGFPKALKENDYSRAKTLFYAVRGLDELKVLITIDAEKVKKDVSTALKDHVNKINVAMQKNWSGKNLQSLHKDFGMLDQISQEFAEQRDIWDARWTREIEEQIKANIEEVADQGRSYIVDDEKKAEHNMRDFASKLIELGRILDELPRFKELSTTKIHNMLETCQQKSFGFAYMFKLGMLLEQGEAGRRSDGKVLPEDERVARVIVKEFKQFKDVVVVMWNEQTAATQKDISVTLGEMRSEQISFHSSARIRKSQKIKTDKKKLEDGFNEYLKEYEQCFEEWFAKRDEKGLADSVVSRAKKIGPCSTKQWTRKVKDELPKMLGRVFAYFTISKSGDSYINLESSLAETKKKVLLKPHNIQILTILRLLGYDSPCESLTKHLMQIRTGEGKSIILGACSVLLGLLGFRVRCVCYSEYLSERDFNSFKDIFKEFQVHERIKYSTITSFSEDSVAAKGDIRTGTVELMRYSVSKAFAAAAASAAAAARDAAWDAADKAYGFFFGGSTSAAVEDILLVDEVDVFFGAEFYGQTYNQVALLSEPEVCGILKFLWEKRGDGGSPASLFRLVKKNVMYQALLTKFPAWGFLLESEVKSMCTDLKNFNKPEYHFDPSLNRIGYRVMDSICYDVVFGYRTAFAYLNEAQKKTLGNVDKALEEALQLRISCGQFSYADINPACILGVSGTIEDLGDFEWEVMTRFGIDTYTCMPSVYGASNFKFFNQEGGDPVVTVVPETEYFVQITDQVIQKVKSDRAVLVFFEHPDKLAEYVKSPYYRKVNNKNLLKECQSHDEKEYVIKKAATAGQATFTTAVFGRGTDFVSNDSRLDKAGGVHVIQTYVSMEKSEEVQIKGRTARQGKKGSYSLILHEGRLKDQLEIEAGTASKMAPDKIYEIIDKQRNMKRAKECQQIEENLIKANARNKLTHEYFNALLANDSKLALKKFKNLFDDMEASKPKPTLKQSRVMCLSDATGSMGPLWTSAKASIREMLLRIEDIAGDNMELMWVAYRDYCDGSDLLEKSPWTNQPGVLQKFVDGIECKGGTTNADGKEAAEVALAEVSTQHRLKPVTRVLLIGDVPPHAEMKGETVHGTVLQTDYRLETAELASLGIPVFTFYTREYLMEFEYIATETGGVVAELEADKLVHVVCENVLEDIGGSELVAEYKAKYVE